MYLDELVVRDYLEIAESVLRENVKEYVPVNISKIKLTKATSYWMQIKYDNNNDCYELSVGSSFKEIVNQELFDNRLTSSCIHELIHTIDGCWNHGKKFKRVCNKVNRKYPQYNLARSTSCEEYGVQIPETPTKYLVTCNYCGSQSRYKRAPKYINSFNTVYSCSVCGKSDFRIEKQ